MADWVNGEDRLEQFHKEARKLYVSFGRSIRRLVEHRLVTACVGVIHDRLRGDHFRQRQYSYSLTKKGIEYIDTH